MSGFFQTLFDPEVEFLRNALVLGLIGSIPLGTVGAIVVVRRISYLAAAVAHSALGGIGLALYCQSVLGWTWLPPFTGALLFTLGSALLVGRISLRGGQREDAAIGTVWVTGMALGLIFIAKTPGYNDPMAYLFGDILLVRPSDLWLAAALAIVVLSVLLLWHRQIFAVCFDPEFAEARGVPTERIYLLLLVLAALTVVTLVTLIGIVLVVALLTLPPALASTRTRRLPSMLGLAILINMLCVFFGLMFSFATDLPAGPSIILLAVALYIAGALKTKDARQA